MRNFLIICVLIVIGIAAYIFLFAGSIVERVIESVGSDATGVSVEVASVDLNLGEQRATINGFTVDNPPGFSGGHIFSLNEISVSVSSVSNDLIELSEVVVDNPAVLYEITENGSNIDVLRANILEYQGEGSGSGGDSDTRIIIDRLRFTGGTVRAIYQGEEVNVDLPPLTLTDLGRASGGETAGQIAVQVADRLTQHVAETVARSEIERRLGIEGVLDRVRGIFGQ